MPRGRGVLGSVLRANAPRPPCQLGSVFRANGGYRVSLGPLRDLGIRGNTRGPTRATKQEADRDLAAARERGSRRGVLDYVRGLSRRTPGAAGARPRADADGRPPPPAAEAAEAGRPAAARAPAGEAPAEPQARRRLRSKAAAAQGAPARAATRVDSGRKRARPASGAASPPEAPPAAGASADGGGGVAGGARRAGAGGEQEAAAAASRRQQRTRAGAGGEQEAAAAPAGGSYEHPGRADWGRVESGISGLLVGLSQTGPPPPCLGPLLSAGADKFDVLHALAMAQSWAHRIRCTRCPSDNEVDVARMLVRMSLDVNLCSDLLDKLVAAKQNCVASHRPSTEHPLKPFEVVDGKALRAKLTRLIGL